MCDTAPEAVRWIASIAVPALAGLAGVIIGSVLSGRRDREQRRLGFVEKQLLEFYSPMLGLRNEVAMRSALRVRVHGAAGVEWAKLYAKAGKSIEAQRQLESNRSDEFTKLIEYDNKQLQNDLLPAYRAMAELFREKYSPADSDTRAHYQQLIEFVELWDRWMVSSIPPEVLESLGHSESKLRDFYDHLHDRHEELRTKLANGKA